MARLFEIPDNIDRDALFSFSFPDRVVRTFGVIANHTLAAGGEIAWSSGVKYFYEGMVSGWLVFTVSRPSEYSKDTIDTIEKIDVEAFLRSLNRTDLGVIGIKETLLAPIQPISSKYNWPLREA